MSHAQVSAFAFLALVVVVVVVAAAARQIVAWVPSVSSAALDRPGRNALLLLQFSLSSDTR